MEHSADYTDINRPLQPCIPNYPDPQTTCQLFPKSDARLISATHSLQSHRFEPLFPPSIQFVKFPEGPKKRRLEWDEKSESIAASAEKKQCTEKTKSLPPIEYSFAKEEYNDDNPVLTFIVDWESRTHEFRINKDDLLRYPDSSFALLYNPVFNEDTDSFNLENVNPKFLHTIFQHIVKIEPQKLCCDENKIAIDTFVLRIQKKENSSSSYYFLIGNKADSQMDEKALERLVEIIKHYFCNKMPSNLITEGNKKILVLTPSNFSERGLGHALEGFVNEYCRNPSRNAVNLDNYSWHEFFELVKTCKRYCFEPLIEDLDFTLYAIQKAQRFYGPASKLIIAKYNIAIIFKQIFEFATNEHEYIKMEATYDECTHFANYTMDLPIIFDNIHSLKKVIELSSKYDSEICKTLFPNDCTFITTSLL